MMVHFGAKAAQNVWHAWCISRVPNFHEGGSVSAFKCNCGAHHSQAEHDLDDRRLLEAAVMRALFPRDAVRRRFLQAVGKSTASAALASFFPFGALEALAQDKGKPQKPDLKI